MHSGERQIFAYWLWLNENDCILSSSGSSQKFLDNALQSDIRKERDAGRNLTSLYKWRIRCRDHFVHLAVQFGDLTHFISPKGIFVEIRRARFVNTCPKQRGRYLVEWLHNHKNYMLIVSSQFRRQYRIYRPFRWIVVKEV